MIGFCVAVKTFDINRGVKFSTYAIDCIKNQILRFIRREKKRNDLVSLDTVACRDDVRRETVIRDTLIDDTKDFVLEYEELETSNIVRELVLELSKK